MPHKAYLQQQDADNNPPASEPFQSVCDLTARLSSKAEFLPISESLIDYTDGGEA